MIRVAEKVALTVIHLWMVVHYILSLPSHSDSPPSCSQIENGKLGPLSLSFFCILCAFFPLFISLLPCVSLALFPRAASSSSSSSFRVTAIHLTSSRHFLSWLPQRERDQVCVCVCVACTQADKTPGRTPLGTTRGGRG